MEHTKNRKVVLMKNKDDKKLDDCYEELFKKVLDLQLKYSNQMVAGTMMAQALKIYKSTLNDEGFEAMVDTISESRDNIVPFDKPIVH